VPSKPVALTIGAYASSDAALTVVSSVDALDGVKILVSDLAKLVDLLSRVGRAEELELAIRIEQALSYGVLVFNLSPAERDTLLSVLDDRPPSD
jgi:hypothetical protein